MTVLFATVGYTPEKVTHALTREGGVASVTLFFGAASNRATARAVRAVRSACKPLALPVKEVEIGSAYDFVAAVQAYRREVRLHEGKKRIFNLSGGTGVMQAAAAFVSFTEGIPSVYYNREEGEYVRMPEVRLRPEGCPSDQQRRILKALLKEREGLPASELARRVRLSLSHLDYHVGRLRAQGLVQAVETPPARRRRLVPTELAVLMEHA